MKRRALGQTGLSVSILGLGASSFGGVFHTTDLDACTETVHAALDGGINFIDVSPAYGATLAELNLGRALEGIGRHRYYLATKVGSYSEARGDYDYSRSSTLRSVEHSIKRLGVEYLDLVQCHDVEFASSRQILEETLPALLELKSEGIVQHVGITGLPLTALRHMVEQDTEGLIETVLSFCRYGLNDTGLESLLPLMETKSIGVINASPTGMGLLTPQGPPPWHPASEKVKAGCRLAVDLCNKNGWDIGRLALQFACANPRLATTLVSTTKSSRIRQNIEAVEANPDWDAIHVLREVLGPIHGQCFTRGLPENQDQLTR